MTVGAVSSVTNPVEYLGSIVINSPTQSGSQTITVPAGTNFAVIFYAGRSGSTDYDFDDGKITGSIGGYPLTWRGRSGNYAYTEYGDIATLTAVIYLSGDQTFTWNAAGTSYDNGFFIGVSFYSNVDLSDPVIDFKTATTVTAESLQVGPMAWSWGGVVVGQR